MFDVIKWFNAMFPRLQSASYGGYLRFVIVYSVAQDSGNSYSDVDIELIVSTIYTSNYGYIFKR